MTVTEGARGSVPGSALVHVGIAGVLVLGGVLAASGQGFDAMEWAAVVAYLLVGTAVVITDMRTLKAPNRIVYPSAVLLVGLAAWGGWASLGAAVAGGAAAFGLLLLATLMSKGAMGMGDAKFGALGGIVIGIGGVLVMLAAAFIVAGLIALAAMTVGSYGRRDVIPFTPFLVAGTILAIGAGTSYLSP